MERFDLIEVQGKYPIALKNLQEGDEIMRCAA